jgi:hypothetical protein
MSKTFCKKVEGEKVLVFIYLTFYRLFGRFSACGAQKHHTNIFKNKN